jgi:putative membrane protein insertion efficiency factor
MREQAQFPAGNINLAQRALIGLVWLYRITLGPLLGGHCRFHPTCSQYAIDAINKYGAFKGSWKTLTRLTRCHPLGGRGYDPA